MAAPELTARLEQFTRAELICLIQIAVRWVWEAGMVAVATALR